MLRLTFTIGLVLSLAACGGGDAEPNLLNIKQPRSEGPDEFSVLPTKPLQMPQDLASLPAPTPGGRNLVDPTPELDVAQAAIILAVSIADPPPIASTTSHCSARSTASPASTCS